MVYDDYDYDDDDDDDEGEDDDTVISGGSLSFIRFHEKATCSGVSVCL